jgi:hypothetical protein
MSFNTTSYLAGVGSVVAALTVGLSGGLFMAGPTPYAEQNRLQRVLSSAPIATPTPQIAATVRPEIMAASGTSAPTSTSQQRAHPETIPVIAKADAPERALVMAKAPNAKALEPIRTTLEQERAAQSNANPEKIRAAEARAAERNRSETRKLAERQKQREIELATAAVKRMLQDRDPQQVAEGIQTPRFGFFGQD